MSKTALVRLHRWKSLAFWGEWEWWPVYLPSHVDPSLSKEAAIPHYHVAWNRLTPEVRVEVSEWDKNYQYYGIHVEKVAVRIIQDLPILSPNISPTLVSQAAKLRLIRDWKKRTGWTKQERA